LIKEERKALERNPGDFLKKFEREKMFIKNLIHPNIIKYYDVKECKTRFYIVMELSEADTIDTIFITIMEWKRYWQKDSSDKWPKRSILCTARDVST
jgi:serine/threonine protein kinase